MEKFQTQPLPKLIDLHNRKNIIHRRTWVELHECRLKNKISTIGTAPGFQIIITVKNKRNIHLLIIHSLWIIEESIQIYQKNQQATCNQLPTVIIAASRDWYLPDSHYKKAGKIWLTN